MTLHTLFHFYRRSCLLSSALVRLASPDKLKLNVIGLLPACGLAFDGFVSSPADAAAVLPLRRDQVPSPYGQDKTETHFSCWMRPSTLEVVLQPIAMG
ncbi:hypothetical protein F4803DRAFT_223504 [Xylaria telfairii]|nr:hypothetical protein F4803DRAFT_223504 [Xylaria telfairii]